jgi:hypothetical protein
MNRKQMIRRGWKFAPLIVIAIMTVVGVVVMSLWNWLMPSLFALKPLTFWQAIGLMVLSRLLFGGFRGRPGGGGMGWRRRMWERWEQMTPEEREQFRAGMRGRCGGFEPPEAEPTPGPTA